MNISNLKIQKPSCPKDFFAKLYGHLDNKRENVNGNYLKEKEKSFQFLKNSGKNSHVEKIQMFNEIRRNDKEETIYKNSEMMKMSPLAFPFFSSVVSSEVSNLCPQSAFSAGVNAFLARRRKKEGRQRRQRTTFSNEQTLSLELEYHRSEYISRGRRFELAETLRLTEAQIKIWFQNRRAKDKRIEKAQIDQQYRNLLLAGGISSLVIPQNRVNFCGICIYKNKLLSYQDRDSENVSNTNFLAFQNTANVSQINN